MFVVSMMFVAPVFASGNDDSNNGDHNGNDNNVSAEASASAG